MCFGNPLGYGHNGISDGRQHPFFFFLRPPQYWHEGGPLPAASALVFVFGYVLAYSDSGDEWQQHERDFVFVFAICTPNQTVGRYRLRGLI